MVTERLNLVAATPERCDAEAAGGRDTLAAARHARVPDEWPPEVFEADDVERVRKQLLAHPALAEWTLYYVLRPPTGWVVPARASVFTAYPALDHASRQRVLVAIPARLARRAGVGARSGQRG